MAAIVGSGGIAQAVPSADTTPPTVGGAGAARPQNPSGVTSDTNRPALPGAATGPAGTGFESAAPTPDAQQAVPPEPATPAPTESPPTDVPRPVTPPPASCPPDATTSEPETWHLPWPTVHGFASQGAIKSTDNNYLVQNSKRGSAKFSELGINFTEVLTDRLRWGAQLYMRQVGNNGDDRAHVDWFYLDYRLTDWLGVRAGRIRMPFGLYNEITDIDSARVPVLLPQAMYPLLNDPLLLALTGMELYGYLPLAMAGGLEYRLYGGTLYTDPPVPPLVGLTVLGYDVPYLIGGRIMWEPPVDGLRLGGSAQWLRLDQTFGVPSGMLGVPATPVEDDWLVFRWAASAEYAAHDLTLAAEYGRWRADIRLPSPPRTVVVNERYYVMASYRVTTWLTPGAYFASMTNDVSKPQTRDNYQRDWSLTLRFDINSFWLIKLEGHLMNGDGDGGGLGGLNGSTPATMLPLDWFVFLAKTTVYF